MHSSGEMLKRSSDGMVGSGVDLDEDGEAAWTLAKAV